MIALLREISPHLDRCELTHLPRQPINVERARKQHAAFAATLRELNVSVEFLPPLPDQPDGTFVEDTAVLLPEISVIARPGAPSRLPEIETIATALDPYRPVQRIADDGRLDGGDVLRIGRPLFVASTRRTTPEGIFSLREIVEPFGYEVRTVEIRGCLHLKTACTFIPPHFLVANPAWVNPAAFGNLILIAVDDSEPFGANTLTVAGTTLVSASFPKTERRLREAGITTRPVEISELEKAEAGVTCLTLVLEPRAVRPAASSLGLRPVEVPGVPSPTGHLSQAIVHGGLVYVSPQMPPPTGKRRSRPAVEEQTEQALQNVAVILTSAGSSLPRVLRATIHLDDPNTSAASSLFTPRFSTGTDSCARSSPIPRCRPGCWSPSKSKSSSTPASRSWATPRPSSYKCCTRSRASEHCMTSAVAARLRGSERVPPCNGLINGLGAFVRNPVLPVQAGRTPNT